MTAVKRDQSIVNLAWLIGLMLDYIIIEAKHTIEIMPKQGNIFVAFRILKRINILVVDYFKHILRIICIILLVFLMTHKIIYGNFCIKRFCRWNNRFCNIEGGEIMNIFWIKRVIYKLLQTMVSGLGCIYFFIQSWMDRIDKAFLWRKYTKIRIF